jgi:hypothetical protein
LEKQDLTLIEWDGDRERSDELGRESDEFFQVNEFEGQFNGRVKFVASESEGEVPRKIGWMMKWQMCPDRLYG